MQEELARRLSILIEINFHFITIEGNADYNAERHKIDNFTTEE